MGDEITPGGEQNTKITAFGNLQGPWVWVFLPRAPDSSGLLEKGSDSFADMKHRSLPKHEWGCVGKEVPSRHEAGAPSSIHRILPHCLFTVTQ